LSDTIDTDQLFKKTNIDEMKRLFAFLHALHNALWELLINGRRPELKIEQFNPKPIRGRSNNPGEIVTEQAEDFFLLRLNAKPRQPSRSERPAPGLGRERRPFSGGTQRS
jgi:hypothetical protein